MKLLLFILDTKTLPGLKKKREKEKKREEETHKKESSQQIYLV